MIFTDTNRFRPKNYQHIVEILSLTMEVISDSSRWCSVLEGHSLDSKGNKCDPLQSQAARWDLWGAIRRSAWDLQYHESFTPAIVSLGYVDHYTENEISWTYGRAHAMKTVRNAIRFVQRMAAREDNPRPELETVPVRVAPLDAGLQLTKQMSLF